MDKHIEVMSEKYDFSSSPAAAQLFGNAGRDYMNKYREMSYNPCEAVLTFPPTRRCFAGRVR